MRSSPTTCIPSFSGEVDLRTRLLIVVASVLALFLSCSRQGKVMVLSSPEEASLYILSADSGVHITIDSEAMDEIRRLSGKSETESLFELFGSGEYVEISTEAYQERRDLLELLRHETSSGNVLEALRKSYDDIRGSRYLDMINELSGSFDDRTLSRLMSMKDRVREYEFSTVFSPEGDWEDNKAFIGEWTRRILR